MIVSSRLPRRRAPNEYRSPPAAARAKDALRHRRLRHPPEADLRRDAAVPVEPVVVAPADLRAAPAPRLRQNLSDAEDHAAGRAPRPLAPHRRPDRTPDVSAAMPFASNEAQVAGWTSREKRLKASVVVPYENPDASKAEIKRRAGNKDYAQVFMLSRTAEAHGRRRYWPIYEAAVEAGLPVGIHVFGYSGWAMTNSGWPSFYIEEMTEHATGQAAVGARLIFEGLFEQYRDLKVVLIESGFGWLPALGWRLDKHWERMRDEVPHVKRPPSEYIREHFWVSTQPMEEAEDPEHVIDAMRWIGFDRILFASDYPHWDFDDPVLALPPSLTDAQRRMIYGDNAKKLYGRA